MKPALRGLPAALVLLLLACSKPAAPPSEAVVVAPAAPASVAPASTVAVPAANAPTYDARVIHFGGYGPAAFNANEEAVRQAYGRPFAANTGPEEPGGCYYLFPEAAFARGHAIAFMFEGDKFVRYDVNDANIVAPGGLVLGMTADAVLAAFPGRVETQPHKYEEGGKVLIVKPEDASNARLVFEIDATGKISHWRIGVEPQVYYVEGCS